MKLHRVVRILVEFHLGAVQLVGSVDYNKCSGYDTKLSDSENPVLELWEMWSTPSLPLLPGLL